MYRLRTIPSQIDELLQFLELIQVFLESSLFQVLMIQAVEPLMESDTGQSRSINWGMQLFVAMGAIQFEFVYLDYLHCRHLLRNIISFENYVCWNCVKKRQKAEASEIK